MRILKLRVSPSIFAIFCAFCALNRCIRLVFHYFFYFDFGVRGPEFDSTISSAILFGLTTVTLSAAQFSKLDIVRRIMMRSIVGCVPVVRGDWHDSRSRVKQKLRKAYHGISNFSDEIMA